MATAGLTEVFMSNHTNGPYSVSSAEFVVVQAGAVADYDCVTQNGRPAKAFRCTVAGNLKFTMANGATVTMPVLANVKEDVQVRAVAAAGSTATGLVLYF